VRHVGERHHGLHRRVLGIAATVVAVAITRVPVLAIVTFAALVVARPTRLALLPLTTIRRLPVRRLTLGGRGPVAGWRTGPFGTGSTFGTAEATPAAAAATAAATFATLATFTTLLAAFGTTLLATFASTFTRTGSTLARRIGGRGTTTRRRTRGSALPTAVGGCGFGLRDGGRFGLVHGAENDAHSPRCGQGRSAHFPSLSPPA
jgi:hypothetical protein